jgi:hypothetical protein
LLGGEEMIDKLANSLLIDEKGDCWGERLPDNHQIIAKINEIIEYINSKKD